jgi:DNA-binding beta-propeller fold protein YncE
MEHHKNQMVMKKSLLALSVLLISLNAVAQKLTHQWTSDTLLRVPESVLHDTKNKILYVANINGKSDQKDGNGFISRLTMDGKIETLKWVQGLDAPKGMALVKNLLYVADVTAVAIIDITTGKITNRLEVEGSQFLNDVTADENGDVYVSDSATGRIHLVKNGAVSVYFESKEFKRINGLLALKAGLYIADAGTGVHYRLSKEKKLERFSETSQGADGVVSTGKDSYIVSSWGGEIYFVGKDGKSVKMLDTREQKIHSADIAYDSKTQTVYVPTFFENSVMAYSFTN